MVFWPVTARKGSYPYYHDTKQSSPTKPDKFKLTGYYIDLLEKLQEKLKFSYEVYMVPDVWYQTFGNHGSQDTLTLKEWNGNV